MFFKKIVFPPIPQVWCQQSCFCLLFADVVSELSEYWQTPGLSGMDTIYGPARVTASDLVKKWRISMHGGGSKAEEPRCLFSLTFMVAPNRWSSLVLVQTCQQDISKIRTIPPFFLNYEANHGVQSIINLVCGVVDVTEHSLTLDFAPPTARAQRLCDCVISGVAGISLSIYH